MAGFGEDAYRTDESAGVFADVFDIGVEAGEDEDAAGGKLAGHVGGERETVATGHGDVAEQKIGRELPRAGQGLVGRVGCLGGEAALFEDHRECIGDEMIVIYYKHTLHGYLLLVRRWRTHQDFG